MRMKTLEGICFHNLFLELLVDPVINYLMSLFLSANVMRTTLNEVERWA